MKLKIISLFISCFLFSSVISAQADKRNTYNAGIDPITQGFYFGFDHAIHDYSIGVDAGSSLGLFMPLSVSLCLDNALYFGKVNKYEHKTWHINGRIAYSKMFTSYKPNLLFLVPSIGKSFYLNEKLALNFELGYNFELLNDPGKGPDGTSYTYFGGMTTPNIRVELKF